MNSGNNRHVCCSNKRRNVVRTTTGPLIKHKHRSNPRFIRYWEHFPEGVTRQICYWKGPSYLSTPYSSNSLTCVNSALASVCNDQAFGHYTLSPLYTCLIDQNKNAANLMWWSARLRRKCGMKCRILRRYVVDSTAIIG